jgi:hypothetical protein
MNYDRTGAYLDASLMSMEDHQMVWRTGEGSNQDVSSLARVFVIFPSALLAYGIAGRVLMFFHCFRLQYEQQYQQYPILLPI